MKTAPRVRPLALALLVALGAAATAGCERRLDASKATRENVATNTTVTTTTTTTTSGMPASGNLIGTPPAPPTRPEGAPPETTPVDGPKSSSTASNELTTYEESRKMPLPGQPNDHSNVASDGSQRAGQVDPQSMPPRTDTGPNPPQRDTATAGTYGQPEAPRPDQPAPK